MPTGVFNPFEQKKKPPTKTEEQQELGDIRLDGDSYILELRQVARDGLVVRLGHLIHTLMRTHRSTLLRHGIELRKEGDKAKLEENEVGLKTPAGHICVYIEPNPSDTKADIEVKVFRRIACALHSIPRKVLEANNARVIERT